MTNGIVFTIALIAIDRLSKILAARYLVGKGTVTVIPYLLGLRYLENTGMAFSLLSGKTVFLAAVTAVALAAMAYFIFIKKFCIVLNITIKIKFFKCNNITTE